METHVKISQKSDPVKSEGNKPLQQKSIPNVLQAYKNQTIQRMEDEEEKPIQRKTVNSTGLPDNLKSGIEQLSGLSMDHVRVHYNSGKPAQLQALAYTQGSDIHVALGQERHLPHEAWHVVQQMQSRVQPTTQLKGIHINDESSLEREADVMGEKARSGGISSSVQMKNEGNSSNDTVQMFRFVLPAEEGDPVDNNRYRASKGSQKEAMFSTHKIVHFTTQAEKINVHNQNSPLDLTGEINSNVKAMIMNDITLMQDSLLDDDLRLINKIYYYWKDIITDYDDKKIIEHQQTLKYIEDLKEIRSKYSYIMKTDEELRMFADLDLHKNNLEKKGIHINMERGSRAIYKDELLLTQMVVENWSKFFSNTEEVRKRICLAYFGHLGRTADPQRPGSLIGELPYSIQGTSPNTLSNESKFKVYTVSSNDRFPLLVSETNQFAINAIYSDPKEVYMTDSAYSEALMKIKNSRIILTKVGNVIFIGTETLDMYKPTFKNIIEGNFDPNDRDRIVPFEVGGNSDRMFTTDCGKIGREYYNDAPKFVSGLQNGNRAIPWESHVAGSLCIDGPDKLSLENGARNNFLAKRGTGNKREDIFSLLTHDQFLQNELNKTWYFRIYGPENLGQDIKNQTSAHFPK